MDSSGTREDKERERERKKYIPMFFHHIFAPVCKIKWMEEKFNAEFFPSLSLSL